jgi:hypothetical protein
LALAAGESLDLRLALSEGIAKEGYGWIDLELPVRPADENTASVLKWRHWLSIFRREQAEDAAALSNAHRARLIGVVNAAPRNGHIFLADYLAFFRS